MKARVERGRRKSPLPTGGGVSKRNPMDGGGPESDPTAQCRIGAPDPRLPPRGGQTPPGNQELRGGSLFSLGLRCDYPYPASAVRCQGPDTARRHPVRGQVPTPKGRFPPALPDQPVPLENQGSARPREGGVGALVLPRCELGLKAWKS